MKLADSAAQTAHFVVVLAVFGCTAAPMAVTGSSNFFADQGVVANQSGFNRANFDGPAELPRVHINTGIADTPAPGRVRIVKAGGKLQEALNEASCGDIIKLEQGASFQGPFRLPAKSCDDAHWIVIRTSALDESLPAEGTRLRPCYAGVTSLPNRPDFHCSAVKNVLAKITVAGEGGAGPILFSSGANHYRLIGLEITRDSSGATVYNLAGPDKDVPADHIFFDRVWMHGTEHDETTRGVFLSGTRFMAVVDSYFSDFHCVAVSGTCIDSQAIAGGAGALPMGPFKIENNFLEAAGENIMFGGAAATATPADIEVRRNHLFKPLTWMTGQPGFVGGTSGHPFIVKNLFEIKNAQRVLFEANVLENNWGGVGQGGYSVLLTPKNQAIGSQNVCPTCLVTDVTIRYSTISHVGGVFVLANAASSNGGTPADGERYSIHDVIADDVNDAAYAGRGTFAQISTVPQPSLQNIQIDHVTVFQPNVMFNVGANIPKRIVNFRFTNSIVNAGRNPFTTTGGGTGNCAHTFPDPQLLLTTCFAPFVFSNNAIIAPPPNAPPSKWPAQNLFPANAAAVRFVNYNGGNGGDYRLLAKSPYKNAGSDGRDLGADVDAVMTKIAGVP